MAIYSIKVYKRQYYRSPIAKKTLVPPVTREYLNELCEYLKIKTINTIRINKKPYIKVFGTSKEDLKILSSYFR